MSKSYITVGVEVPGMHYYPESTRPYLKTPHRHDFKIFVTIEVTDPNRQFEFYDVQDNIIAALNELYGKPTHSAYNFGTRSCEHIAKDLCDELLALYPVSAVKVAEDDYNSSTLVLSAEDQAIWSNEPAMGNKAMARKIEKTIIHDLCGYRGLGNEWDSMESADQQILSCNWEAIVEKYLSGVVR